MLIHLGSALRLASVATVALAAGCAATGAYLYVPAAGATAQASGYPAAYYALETGAVRVVSFGAFDARPGDGGAPLPVLHVRLLVANNADDAPWTIDTSAIVATLPGAGPTQAVFVNSDAGTPPVLQIPRGEQRTIDLYFPLAGTAGAEPVAFDVLWQVQTGARVAVERTPFEREVIETGYRTRYVYGYPPAYGYGYSLGLGPHWWYDPHYSGYHGSVFIGHHGFHGGHHYGGHHYGGGHHGGGHHGGPPH